MQGIFMGRNVRGCRGSMADLQGTPNKPAWDKEEHSERRKGVLSEHLQCHLTEARLDRCLFMMGKRGCIQMCKVAASQNTWCIQKGVTLDVLPSGALELLVKLPGSPGRTACSKSSLFNVLNNVLRIARVARGACAVAGPCPVCLQHLAQTQNELQVKLGGFSDAPRKVLKSSICTIVSVISPSFHVISERAELCGGGEKRGKLWNMNSQEGVGRRSFSKRAGSQLGTPLTAHGAAWALSKTCESGVLNTKSGAPQILQVFQRWEPCSSNPSSLCPGGPACSQAPQMWSEARQVKSSISQQSRWALQLSHCFMWSCGHWKFSADTESFRSACWRGAYTLEQSMRKEVNMVSPGHSVCCCPWLLTEAQELLAPVQPCQPLPKRTKPFLSVCFKCVERKKLPRRTNKL
ncbi:hypothetical protein EK904_003445 [Melospiza melodia maxima]|nr:hypothetical protein EK904_003445 [Melospiza melodia maxima]